MGARTRRLRRMPWCAYASIGPVHVAHLLQLRELLVDNVDRTRCNCYAGDVSDPLIRSIISRARTHPLHRILVAVCCVPADCAAVCKQKYCRLLNARVQSTAPPRLSKTSVTSPDNTQTRAPARPHARAHTRTRESLHTHSHTHRHTHTHPDTHTHRHTRRQQTDTSTHAHVHTHTRAHARPRTRPRSRAAWSR